MTAQTTNSIWYCGSTKYTAVAAFPLTTSVVAGAVYRQLTTPTVGNERCFVVTTAGLTTTEPTWTVTKGAANTSGTAVFTECTGIAGLNGDTTNSPAWLVSGTTTLGQVIYVTSNGSLQIVTTPGTNGSGSIPSFSATAGVTTTDNTTHWTSLGAASNFSAYAAPFARIKAASTATWMANNDTCYVSNNHAETQGSTITVSSTGLKFICVTDTVAPPTTLNTTATVSATGAFNVNLTGASVYFDGITFNAGSSSSTGNVIFGNSNPVFANCSFVLNNTSASSQFQVNSGVITNNCTWVFGAAGQSFAMNVAAGYPIIEGGSIAATGTVPTSCFTNAGGLAQMLVRDCDLSGLTGNIVSSTSSQYFNYLFTNCKLNGSATKVNSTNGALTARFHNCDSSGTNYTQYFNSGSGTSQQSTSTYRSGGATNPSGTQESLQIVSNTNPTFYAPFQIDELAVWNTFTSGTHTATVYITSDSALTNGDVWIEVEYLGASGSPLGSTVTTRKTSQFASNVALTTDSSTWTGAKANKYSISATYSPLLAGILKVRIYVGTVSLTLYVDPLIVLA